MHVDLGLTVTEACLELTVLLVYYQSVCDYKTTQIHPLCITNLKYLVIRLPFDVIYLKTISCDSHQHMTIVFTGVAI